MTATAHGISPGWRCGRRADLDSLAAAMLHVSLLGEQIISDAAGVVRTPSSRSIALVAFLALHAEVPQPRQRIAALFWPDSTDEQALTNLRRELHHLRQALGEAPSLVVTSKHLCWRDTAGCRADVRVFAVEREAAMAARAAGRDQAFLAHASAALDAYRGEFLPGALEDWQLQARAELEQQCVDLLDPVCRARAAAGDLAGAVDAARRRVVLRPLEEVGYRRLIELQGELGDRSGAANTYHHCASMLERELGIEPSAPTRAALDRLLTQPDPAAPRPPPTTPPAARSGLAGVPFVGRSAELATLRALWASASAGRPTLAVVRGGAGVGKTRLVAELAELARARGAVTARTQCFGAADRLALSPVADWLRAASIQAGLRNLDPVWRAEVSRLVPSGKRPAQPLTSLSPMGDSWQRHRFFEGLARALLSGGRPLLLVLDNLQWCDQETLAFLSFCLGLAAKAPVMVAATLRADTPELSAELAEWTARMRATGTLTEVTLGPLDIPETARLAEAVSGRAVDDMDAPVLHAATGGFPLHVVEAARSGADGGAGPLRLGDLSAVLSARLDQLSPPTREVAGLAAGVGQDFTLDLLIEASDLDADSMVRAVDELWRHRIVQEVDEGYDFSHDLLRDAAYSRVSPPRRWLLHRRLAQALELLHADDLDAVSARLAQQYARGGRAERAVDYYRRAADVAAARFGHAEAIRLHEQALTLLHTLPEGSNRAGSELRVLEAMAAPLNARYGYSSPRLHATLERTVRLAETLGRRDSMLTGLVGLWGSQFVQGSIETAHHTATRALTLAEPASELSGAAHFAFGGSAASLGRPAEGLRHLTRAASEAGHARPLPVGTRPDVHARAWAAHAQWLLGADEESRGHCVDAVALARTADEPYSLAVALAYAAITYQLLGDVAKLAETVAELGELCERYRFAYYREWGLILGGWSMSSSAGLELARRGVSNLTEAGSFARMPYWLSVVADLSAGLGRPGEARATLDAALVGAHARGDNWWLPEVLRMRAGYDDVADAVPRLRRAARLAAEQGSVALLRRCERDLAARGVPAPSDTVPPARPPAEIRANGPRTARS